MEKHTYDVFSNSDLKKILEKESVNTLIITGVNTDICVDTTVRRAFTEGYFVIIPSDLVATVNMKIQKHFLDIFNKFFGEVTTSDNVLKRLRQKQ